MHTFAIIAFLLITAPMLGQDTEIAAISDALSQGNASRLSAFFDRSVDLMIEGEGEVLSSVLQAFRLVCKKLRGREGLGPGFRSRV